MRNDFWNRGQALLEITISLGIILVIVTVLTMAVLDGLKNSQFSQDQTQATKLAEETINTVKTIKARNCPVNMGYSLDPEFYFWQENTNLIWDVSLPTPANFHIDSVNCEMIEINASSFDAVPVGFEKFQRKVTMVNEPSTVLDRKKVRVEVSWYDANGLHSSVQETILTEN